MKQLETKITKNGFTYRQLYTGPEGYIYEQNYDGEVIAYEAFRRVENTQFDCISFPGNEAFGKWAWSCRTLERAQDRLCVSIMPISS